MQLYLIVPFSVLVYRRSPRAGIILQFSFIATSSLYFMIMADVYNIKASGLNTEGFYIFAYMINKPWCKLFASALGVLLAFAYADLLKYRKLKTEVSRKACFPAIHNWATRKWVSQIVKLLAIGIIVVSFCSSLGSHRDTYKQP